MNVFSLTFLTQQFAREKGLESEWKDVLEMITLHEARQRRRDKKSSAADVKSNSGKVRQGSPLYGHPLLSLGLVFAPTNEIGVVYLFGMLARELGFVVLRMQAEFPDCEVMRLVDGGRWQRLLVEFEYQSRNFPFAHARSQAVRCHRVLGAQLCGVSRVD